MSTLSSLVLTASSTLTLDFIKPKFCDKMKDKRQLSVIRILILVFIALSAVIAIVQYKHKSLFIAQLMLIIRGVNVFPSQIESVLLSQGYTANYQILVDRANNFDSIEVNVEMNPEIFSDTVRGLVKKEKELEEALKSLLGISAKVHLLEPNSIERSTGKAVRVIDKRKLID